MSAHNRIILGVGVVWACLTAAVGAIAVSVGPHSEKRNSSVAEILCKRSKRFEAHIQKQTTCFAGFEGG